MSNSLNVELGPVDVSINGVDIGHQQGGAEFTYEPNWKEIFVDKYGETPVDYKLKGEKISVKVRFAEFTIANLKKVMPEAVFGGAANARITLGSNAGARASSKAVELVLHPSDKGTREDDIVLYRAYPIGPITLVHNNDDDKVYEAEFVALVDETKSNGNYLGLIGDSTA